MSVYIHVMFEHLHMQSNVEYNLQTQYPARHNIRNMRRVCDKNVRAKLRNVFKCWQITTPNWPRDARHTLPPNIRSHRKRVFFPLWSTTGSNRPTQSTMYVPLQVNRFGKSILLIVQYKYLKSSSGIFNSSKSDPLHKIMQYWLYYSIYFVNSFLIDHNCHLKMFCTTFIPVSNRNLSP